MKPRSVLLVSTGAAGMHAKWRWVTVTGGTASARPTCAFGIRCAPALIWLGGLPTRLRKTRRWKFLAALNTRAAAGRCALPGANGRSEEHTSELQSRGHLVCSRLLDDINIEVLIGYMN